VAPVRFSADRSEHQAVVVFDAVPEGFRSRALLPGGFMPLRSPGDPPGVGGAARRGPVPAGLQVVDHVGALVRVLLLDGPGLAALRPSARTRLLRALLMAPRRGRLLEGADPDLDVFLPFRLHDHVRLLSSLPGDGRPPASGIGLVEPDGAGAALEVDYREVIPPLAAARPRWVGARHRRLVVQLPG
jgi:hypothetical protein